MRLQVETTMHSLNVSPGARWAVSPAGLHLPRTSIEAVRWLDAEREKRTAWLTAGCKLRPCQSLNYFVDKLKF